ncbi:hypothetical protein TSUD_316580 [Trifolium subterraneum]|uniref:Uncharacterized protein n=1 Tax=Trifolium subterraneum TaxID=3900 RepID=A0A2Z6NIU7_TRISU|nr:hypothetical protein TSUD_316580 [Trifolium subterraneum]
MVMEVVEILQGSIHSLKNRGEENQTRLAHSQWRNSIVHYSPEEVNLFRWNLDFPKLFPKGFILVAVARLSHRGFHTFPLHLSIVTRLNCIMTIVCTLPANDVFI